MLCLQLGMIYKSDFLVILDSEYMQNMSNSIQYTVLDILMEFGGQQAFHAGARETSYGDKSAL